MGFIFFLMFVLVVMLIWAMRKAVRCPNCTQVHKMFSVPKDYSCKLCGTPIIVNGEWAASQDRTQEKG